jgi:hypothetical protein
MMVGGCHQRRCGAAQRRRSGHGSDQERQPLRTVTPCQDFDAIAMAIVGDGQPVAGMCLSDKHNSVQSEHPPETSLL